MIEDRLEAVFSELGQRNSAPRRLLTEALTQLAQTGEGFTSEDLWHRLKQSNDSIGRATVFRAVKQLVERDVLDCIDFSDGTRLYRACGGRLHEHGDHHHHLACTTCHRISNFHFCFPNDQLEKIGENESFRVLGHTLTLYGTCKGCQDAASEAATD
jgi:Fur family ferric uptake transcriptional regulator